MSIERFGFCFGTIRKVLKFPTSVPARAEPENAPGKGRRTGCGRPGPPLARFLTELLLRRRDRPVGRPGPCHARLNVAFLSSFQRLALKANFSSAPFSRNSMCIVTFVASFSLFLNSFL